MQEPTRQGAKLVKRRPTGSPSPTRGRLSSANPYPGETPAVPPLNPSEASGSYSCVAYSTMPEDKDKKSKWRLSNPFHSKDKDKDKERKDNRDSLGDSAYASSEPNNNSRSDTYQDSRTGNVVTTTQDFTGHPPIPNRSNMRHRVELDSVSPGVEHANPLASPVSPGSPTRANFSYPARTPPPGVPRKIPSQDFAPQQSLAGQPSNPQYSQYPTQPQGQPPMHQNQLNQQQSQQQPSYGFPSGPHPAPLRPGHIPESSQNPQKPSTLANLKTAAAGIHGAGETLRGTLNNTVDKRFMKPNSAVHAKNQAAIERGRTEIETGHYVHSQRKPTANAPGPAQAPTENTPYQQRPGGTGISGSRIEPEGRSGSKLGGFIKKVKDGQVNSQRMDGRDGNLQVVNE
ncbi:hypothetical protein K491DRAFT_596198 [Lophiostoma macrostomum CBS 122681]|uniref:Uncharacterized protein n=1 Tax=Lophiostoma macrostomum CBS 122681 TaxID=1314788 RepID=A0A6A6TC56_9PLEO|nr:hypothetical protein K491DRAFT_596198 [Lophiostoma macrostomum CBS 122681]